MRPKDAQERRDATVRHRLILHAGPEPDIRPEREPQGLDLVLHSVRPLGQYLVGVLRCVEHRGPHVHQKLVRYILVEEVAHAVDEDTLGLAPVAWGVETVWVKGHVEAVREPLAASEPLSHCLGVAVVTPRGDLGAARDWVPCGVGPTDLAVLQNGASADAANGDVRRH